MATLGNSVKMIVESFITPIKYSASQYDMLILVHQCMQYLISRIIMVFWFLPLLHASLVLVVHISNIHAVNMQDGNASMECVERERQSLLALKQGFVDHYAILSSWGNHKDCCKWEGVHCSIRTGHVIKLDLRADPNPLEGTITPSFVELRHLKYLDLSFNYFDRLTKFPRFIASLTHLKYLSLSSTNLKGKLPSELGDLVHLEYLDLANNELTGRIPHRLGNLSSLQFLDLSMNYFTRTNLEWLSHLTSLNSLNLSNTDLSEAKNWIQQVSRLSLLRELQLVSCNLTDSEPWSSPITNTNSSSLVVIRLSDNNLTSSGC